MGNRVVQTKSCFEEIEKDNVYQLQFDGVYENSTVWVNGQEVGGQKYGYSRFTLELQTAFMKGTIRSWSR